MIDGGPIYHETQFGHWLVEPWNAFSSLLFLVPVIYFLFKLKGQYKHYGFLIFWCSPLLVMGGLGSTIFHAFRSHRFFLYLDFVPIALLTLSISIYFFLKLIRWWWVVLIIILSFLIRFSLFSFYHGHGAINASYVMTGVLIFLPALLFLIKTRFFLVSIMLWALLCFGVALLFRFMDDWNTISLSLGTHWLWHVFCAVGAWFLGSYLIKIADINLSPGSRTS
jgi:hemolysin III